MKNLLLLIFLVLFHSSGIAQTSEQQLSSTQKGTLSNREIKVFPNPATNVVNVLGLKNTRLANIIISDISGNIVMRHQWAIRKNAISIPIPNLNSGIYVIRIESEEQRIQTKFYKN